MSIPDYQGMMLPVLRVAAGGETRIKDAQSSIADQLGLTDEERSEMLPSGTQATYINRIHWAKFYLVKAGLLESRKRGYFSITDAGTKVLESNPAAINRKYLQQFDAFNEYWAKSVVGKDIESSDGDESILDERTPDEVMRSAYKQVNNALSTELLDKAIASSPEFFERLIVNLLVSMGYGGSVEDAGRALGKSGDDGVDGVIDQDALGLDRVYIQAKRYSVGNNVSAGDIRNFFGSLDMFKATKGVFVTTSAFTRSAIETTEKLGKRIVLIDGDRLTSLMIKHNVGCRIEETLSIKKLDEEFFDS